MWRLHPPPSWRRLGALGLVALAACSGGGHGGGSGPDTRAPTLSLDAPTNLDRGLSGTIDLSATASDDVGVTTVEFEIDGQPLASRSQPPWKSSLDSTLHASGQHVLRARARDAAGNLSPWSIATVQFGGARALPAGFTRSDLTTSLSSATAMAQAGDGRFFIAQQGGVLRVVKNGAPLPDPFVALAVDAQGERGLIGVTLSPDFTRNQYVYVYYTTTTSGGGVSGTHNRVSRFTAAGDVAAAASEQVLVELPALSSATNHNGGALHFGVDGKLYVAVGENASGARAQDLADPFGKLLRFNEDGSIPGDNPFCGTPGVLRCAVWALGLRNPFTFAVQPGTGRLHINDVGENTWEEIDLGAAGANYGWPTSEGPLSTSGFAAPLFAYKHSAAVPAGSGPGGFFTGQVITGGTFYPDAATAPFPAAYRGAYLFADFASGFIARLDTANDNAAYSFASGFTSVVDLLVGQDGALYVLTQGALTRISAP